MTRSIEKIQSGLLDSVWPRSSDFLARALAKSQGEMDLIDVRMMLERGAADLFVASDGDEIIGCAVVQFVNYPRIRAAHITLLGGEKIVGDESLFEEFKRLLRDDGASWIEAYVLDEAISRLLRSQGIGKVYELVRGSL